MVACPLVVNGVDLVLSRFRWCRACLEPVALMAYGKNGSMCWLAGAVRMLQKRVELLEAATNCAKSKDDDLHDFNHDAAAVRALVDGPVVKAVHVPLVQVVEKTIEIPQLQIHDLHDFKHILSDGDGANADLCVPRQKTVHVMDFFDVTAYNRVETVPLRHVSFAETVEMVEFDPAVVEYDAPAPTVAQQARAVPAPVEKYDAPAACATPSPSMDGLVVKVVHDSQLQVVEKTIEIPQLQAIEEIVDIPEIHTVQFTENLDYAPDLEMTPAERILRIPLADCEEAIEELSRAMAEGFSVVLDDFIENFDKPDGLSAVVDEYFEKFDEPVRKHESDEYVCGTWASEKGESNMTRSQELAVLTIKREWRWMHKKIELRAANEERLRVKMQEVRYNLFQRLPKGVSAKKMEGLKEIQFTLKYVEKKWRMLFNEELVTLEIEFRCSSRDSRVPFCLCLVQVL